MDKILVIESYIRFYTLEDGDGTAEGGEAETFVVHDSNLAVFKQNLVKRKFPYINTLDSEVPAVVSVMRDLTVGVSEHLDITSYGHRSKVIMQVAYPQRTCA